ncbi:hypothetical protein [Streptacidiphilus jiangxiensis]|uniref:Uncharacterized protein n=1 Tax=Streptacidiphilus jiangxiensis TaxID=235985 RepID=A0A1H7FJV6_STRJI|nr:hypothetical protein [Streptacidiphilus jiangxiensis]SEK26393.1 hypothetical protein SAMN05414137_101296 [Streptacidiphilus jiangxiensis]
MYEQPKIRPVRKPVRAAHAPATPVSGLRGQLAGHLAALLDVTRELHARTGDPALEDTAAAISARIAELGTQLPPRAAVAYPSDLAVLHAHAFDLAGRVLVVAASQQDTRTAILACRRMDVHTAARESLIN